MTKKSPAHELLTNLENFLAEENFGESPKELYQPIRYILSLGGKRIRPLLALLSYGLYQDDPEKILGPAAAIEVFHNFTLMHDDIMDEAPLRRGKATVHEKWNPNVAILSGDVMLVRAYDLLLKSDHQYLPEIIRLFNQTAAEVCEGQQLDMNFESLTVVEESEYINMIRLKTAVLLGHALQLGAILAGAPSRDSQLLYEFGVNIGIGFQLKDDLLDVFADQAKFGKQVGGDIISNKKTFLLIKALEAAKGQDLMELNTWLSLKEFDKTQKVNAVTALYEKLGIRKLTEEKMNFYFSKGFDQLESISFKNPDYHETLLSITQDLVHREK
ncbi:polyprenyl synthetase family protein [Algoriphagus hitonicola]|uniref:Geranylgeranyl diphosphate synthase, type II n=1 Tax=Algoriphagus hitonicola TaxID=435880 RepID=A0A1I2UZX5_9BACT|nr:polyprenyl synthetase family protein [Algoriphagus hitonicola]SFG81719.1 geranylgeranyl diphosphate synthase, type II [Algoriphagus hitonicola]